MNSADIVYSQPEEEGEAVDPAYQRFLTGLNLTKTNLLPHYQENACQQESQINTVLPHQKQRRRDAEIHRQPNNSEKLSRAPALLRIHYELCQSPFRRHRRQQLPCSAIIPSGRLYAPTDCRRLFCQPPNRVCRLICPVSTS